MQQLLESADGLFLQARMCTQKETIF
jgi:hypothetical protein